MALVTYLGLVIFAIVAITALFAFPVMWLWNGALVGAVDGIHPVSFWQAWGISLLCGLLFRQHTDVKAS